MRKFLPDIDIEPVLHIVLIAVAVAVSWTYWHPGEAGALRDPLTVHTDSSEVLSTWRPAKRRVVLFVSPTCPYCRRSMDFYARLSQTVDSLQQTGASVAVAAVIDGTDSPRAQHHMLRSSKVNVDTLLQTKALALPAVGVSGVPTVAILDAAGQTRSAWRGLQDSTGEREILSAVRAMGAAP